jgi:hypothetical protein
VHDNSFGGYIVTFNSSCPARPSTCQGGVPHLASG